MNAPHLRLLTVSDLHRSQALYHRLDQAVAEHQPDVVVLLGDFLHAFPDNEGRLTPAACAEALGALRCREVVFVPGNHEDWVWQEFKAAWPIGGRPWRALCGEAFVHGPLVAVGFPCLMGLPEAFCHPRNPLPTDPSAWLPEVMRPWGAAARTLWLMHEPPCGTPLSERASVVEGNPEWTEAIERYSPWLAVFGHDHQTPIDRARWHCRLGQTVCVNVGQSDHGPLHYAVIEADFAKATPSLPTRMKVTAYPFQSSVGLPTR